MSPANEQANFVADVINDIVSRTSLTELEGPNGGPYLPLTFSESPEQSAGAVRLWRAADDSPLDRMLHMRLLAGPVDTQLLFLFGRADSSMPHFHLQTVQFPPDGCVYNADILPRLDPVTHPNWFTRVFSGLRRPYKAATTDRENSCAQAPANPALAFYMSPYGIASARTDTAELAKVAPQLQAYVDHYLALAGEGTWPVPEGVDTIARDKHYLQLFFADELDPRAWHGVYKVIGEARGKVVKQLLRTPLKLST